MGEPFTPYENLPSHRSLQSLKNEEDYQEEPYTIKCICGFDDDAFDGATVFCEQCNTWQHIACYYLPNTTLAPDAEHSCIDCKPHQRLDAGAAALHQKALRLPQGIGEDRKGKRNNTKNHRKSKTRDLNNNAVHINGFALPDGQSHTPSTGSPRDSAPPAKKPKTSHRPSASITNGINRSTNGRHRSTSITQASALPPRPPLDQCPESYLSPDFIRIHQKNTEFNPVTANLHLDISVTGLLSQWLDDPDAFYEATNGLTHSDVFKQFPHPIEELETPIHKIVHQVEGLRFHGSMPQWPFLAVDKDLVEGDFVGEIRGCIGRREDYQADPVNQWNKLRHPDHFVFFHPHLPIYIDARQEGTILRYARRSCRPNLKMETIITGAREYRFCFTALEDIPRGTEITIAWDTKYDPQLTSALSRSPMTTDDKLYVSDFFGTNLAHFGGCACENQHKDNPPDPRNVCFLIPFDRRHCPDLPNGLASENKAKRKRGSKRPPPQDSTLSTNSRETSEEALLGNHDGDLDMLDGRSTTQSTRSSRDGTPSTTARPETNGHGLSERDKKKLAQQEKLFEQMEHDRQPSGQKKKKRNSGSNANTPTMPSHRQAGRGPLSPSNPSTPVSGVKMPFIPPYRSPAFRGSPSNVNAGRSVQHKPAARPTRPVYVDASTQTLSEDSEPQVLPTPPKRVLPRSKQLLRRSLFQCHLRNQLQTAPGSPHVSNAPSPTASQAMDTDSSRSHSPPNNEKIEQPPKTPFDPAPQARPDANPDSYAFSRDTDMPDADAQVRIHARETSREPFDNSALAHIANPNPIEPVKPPPPPWPTTSLKQEDAREAGSLAAPIAPMHVDLSPTDFVKPTVPAISSPSNTLDIVVDPITNHAAHPAQSPHPLTIPATSARTPEANSLTKPSPVKKKMSLSDYMSKRNKGSMSTDKTPTPGSQGSPPRSLIVSEGSKGQSPSSIDEAKS